MRALVEDCCGWNRKIWADAVEFTLSHLPERLDGKKVLEIGAGKYSSIAPIFASKGAELLCSYYGQQREDIENGHLRFVTDKYKLDRISAAELEINTFEGIYDIVFLKSVLGGICRSEDYVRFRSIVEKLLTKNMREGGYILTVDNGHVALLAALRNIWGAGKNSWTYFKREKMMSSLSGFDVQIRGFGLLNAGSARFLFRGNFEMVNDMVYVVDKVILRLMQSGGRAVLATIIRKTSNTAPHQSHD
jgi:hypothetical protein